MTTETSPAAQTGGAAAGRVFLVVVDDTTEWRAALRFACRRASHTGGRVALLHVVEPSDVQHWMTVEEGMREERRPEAEQLLQRIAKEGNQLEGKIGRATVLTPVTNCNNDCRT